MGYKYWATCTTNTIDCTTKDLVMACNNFRTLYMNVMSSLRENVHYSLDPMPGDTRVIRWRIEDAYGSCLFGIKLVQKEDFSYSIRVFRHQTASAPGLLVWYWLRKED